MNGKDVFLNLISFGAYGRVKKTTTKYEAVFSEYTECNEVHGNHAAELSMALVQLAEEKRGAYSEAKKNAHVASELPLEEPHLAESEIMTDDYSLEHVDGTVKAGEAALSTFAGAAAGAAAFFVTWVIAGRFGMAAAGETIAALSGMDRVRATAMWLGGGVLPHHTGNPAAGMLVMTGIFLVPMLFVSSAIFRFFAVRKIEKTNAATEQTEDVIRRIREDLPRLETLKDQAKGMIQTVQTSKRVFLDWYEVCCMNEAQRKDKLKTLAADMLKIIQTPMSLSVNAPADPPEESSVPEV